MKTFIVLFAFVLSGTAMASSELVADVEMGRESMSVWQSEFEVNRAKDRVRVSVIIEEESQMTDSSHTYHEFKKNIEGLKYEVATKTVYVERDGKRIDCGYFYNQPWVIDLGKSFRASGNCNFVTKKVSRMVDDGFETYKVTNFQVFFEVVE